MRPLRRRFGGCYMTRFDVIMCSILALPGALILYLILLLITTIGGK